MTAHKRKEWYIVAKNKRLTNKEKQARAEFKKRMQDKGVLPLDKPKLNRKKFIDEARKEWNGRSSDCFIWEHYLMDAISYMLCQREGMSSRASLEAVGAAKVLKLAIRLREFSEEVRKRVSMSTSWLTSTTISRTSWMPRKEQTHEYSLQEDDKPRVNQYPGGNEERTWH